MNAKDAMIEDALDYEHRIAMLENIVRDQAASIICYKHQAKEYEEFVKMLKNMLERKYTA